MELLTNGLEAICPIKWAFWKALYGGSLAASFNEGLEGAVGRCTLEIRPCGLVLSIAFVT